MMTNPIPDARYAQAKKVELLEVEVENLQRSLAATNAMILELRDRISPVAYEDVRREEIARGAPGRVRQVWT